jgi:hypothetical protein
MKKYLLVIALGFSSIIYGQVAKEFPVLKGDYLGQKPVDMIPEVFAPEIISGFIHGFIAISPNGDEIFWIVNGGKEQIFYSKIEKGTWTKPALANFNSTYNNGSPVFSPDGKRLFFNSTDRPEGMGGSDAWYVERTDSGWSSPINVGKPYNSTNDEPTPLFTKMGHAYRTAGLRNSKEPLRFKYSNSKFSEPTPMIVLPEFSPWWSMFISPEEDYLIFTGGSNNADLYICFKEKDGKWGNPINMGDKINTEEWERFPVVSPDGKYLFFTRGGGSYSKVFWVSTKIFNNFKKGSKDIPEK